MDVRALRRRLGPTVGLIGGVDSRLLQGPVEAIPDQVARQLEPLLAGGRVAPMLDDRVRSITPLAAFEVYRTALGALLDQR